MINTISAEQKAAAEKQLFAALEEDDRARILVCLQKGAAIDARTDDASRQTPLHKAVWKENVGLVRFLLEQGAPIFAKNREGKTPIDLNDSTRSPSAKKGIADLLLNKMPDAPRHARLPQLPAAEESFERTSAIADRDVPAEERPRVAPQDLPVQKRRRGRLTL